MATITGVFEHAADAKECLFRLHQLGITDNAIVVLWPGAPQEATKEIPLSEGEQPGMGAAMGEVLGGAVGAAGGFSLGAAVASLLLPGVGPILVGGLIGTTLLGLGGVQGGKLAGEAIEDALFEGLPRDEVFVYEDALRQGRTVIVVETKDEEEVRAIMAQAGAESIDAARKKWWLGLRQAEKERYMALGEDFERDEIVFRTGFEAAQSRALLGKSFEEAFPTLSDQYPDVAGTRAFRAGYESGRTYADNLRNQPVA
ncbi:MAG: hypothetical protein WD696_07290 [Bryobacteraceae bacterium]